MFKFNKKRPSPAVNFFDRAFAEKDREQNAGPAFKQGDVVQLKSRGTAMTVTSNCCCGEVEVSWFDQKDELQVEYFATAVLKPFNDEIPF